MPYGYLVSLSGDNTLSDATIGGSYQFFRANTSLGDGEWAWSGNHFGTDYYNQLEPGEFFLAGNGSVYFVPDYGSVGTPSEATITVAPYFSPDNKVQGTNNDDVIDDTYVDTNGNSVDSGDGTGPGGFGDEVYAKAGNDTVDVVWVNPTLRSVPSPPSANQFSDSVDPPCPSPYSVSSPSPP